MGSGTVFSIRFGQGDRHGLKEGILASFVLLGAVTVVLSAAIFAGLSWIIQALRTPEALVQPTREYLQVIFLGMAAIFLYNFFASPAALSGGLCGPSPLFGGERGFEHRLDLWFVAGCTGAWPGPQRPR